MSPAATPATLLPELALARETGARLIAGVDEVGRGALAGPVSIGVVVVDLDALPEEVKPAGVWTKLDGVRDSKLLTPAARTRWHPQICEHASAFSVQHSGPETIDAEGLTRAMSAAGRAGLTEVERQLGRELDMVILDGIHDWITGGASPRVRTMAKADTRALSVACASVLAKVERDELMTELDSEYPQFGWASNKGYGSAAHREAIRLGGPSVHHRRSWNLG
ncbi:ribonuclease HII [Nesterenkonia sp. MY13]|uniref:Ribonuclease n=1 Tax=Nesterenkonia sedimenti TaxID=1463632 RepID=A0A7X8TK58_9MICC|nr:ribonuclease HII [Nesterenkonia sedimenti]NLS10081.1 ribonuclease HII [Nesterenkonia sedimenti]